MAALRHRDFRLLFFGKVFGWTAVHMVMVAIGYQVYDRTGDLMNLAYIGLATFAPGFVFALFTGYAADRFDRKLVLGLCYVVMLAVGVLFLLLSLAGLPQVWPVFFLLTVLGTARAFYQPAANSLVPNVVPAAVFPNAVAWHTSMNKVTQVAGPALGGVLYLAGPEVVYATASGGFAVAVVTMFLIRTRTTRAGREPASLATLLAGIRYVYAKKIVFGAITVDLFVVLLGGVTALLPVYARDILQTGPSGAGFLRSAMAAGALLTGLALTRMALSAAVGRILMICIFIYGGMTVLFGVSQWYWLSLLAMAILGAADMVSVVIRHTLLQIATPDEMRGRVSAVNAVFTGASNELGEFRAGTMAALIGVVPAVVIGGLGAMAVAAVGWRLFPELVRVERMDRSL
jgi:MFS family permease